jgi:hypothetical protein
MAPSLISLEEAAKQLNITPAELNDRRERQEIYGYRDGASWKFKQADVERFKEKLATGAAAADDMGLDDLSLDDSDDMLEVAPESDVDVESDSADDADDSIDVMLLSEAELGESAPGASSTIIGKPGVQNPAESDIKIVTDQDRAASGAPTPGTPGSDIHLAAGGESSVLGDDSADFGVPPASDSDKPSPGSDISLGDAAAMSVDEFSLEDDDSASEGFALAGEDDSGAGSSDELSVTGDDDLVLGGAGSDITLGAADSGISLANPADSGLSLEEPFDLTDTGGGKQQDFEMDSDDMLSLSDDSDSVSLLDDSSSEMSDAIGDEDFLLEPSLDVDSDESGSQVIALDEDSIGSSSFLEDSEAGESMLEDDSDASPIGGLDTGDYGAPAAAGVAVSREAAFTGLNIASLSVWTLFMLLCGMMMLDMMRNMWSWQGNFTVTSSLMDTILGMLP